jgi:formate dehydrogenase maturation protein FdhE
MTQVGASKHAPIPIGDTAKLPFARLPDPKILFARCVARLAAEVDASRLASVGSDAHDTRFYSCALCGTLWSYVRIKYALCGSGKGINYRAINGGAGTVSRGYVKIPHQHVDPSLEPVADDAASLTLDPLVREADYRRGAVNPFMLDY